jgi:aryl-alcohol dehydrogenase-like predicted oxidoreductase
LCRAVELGVTFIDTADSYGPDVSEELIGETLSPYPDDLVVATKGGLERMPQTLAHQHGSSPRRVSGQASHLVRPRRENRR